MGDPIIYLRRNGETRRLVGPHAERVAKQRLAEGWERYTPPAPYDATAAPAPARKSAKRTRAKTSRKRSPKTPKAKKAAPEAPAPASEPHTGPEEPA